VICDLGNLAGSSQATVSISVTANSAGTFTNLVNVSANETETDMANNMATHMVDVQDGTPPPPPPAENADMEVKLDVSTEKARVGDTVTYTATVKNKGPGLASGAELNNALPSSLSFVSANTSQGSCGGGSTVSCSLGELSANSTVIVQIVVTVVKRERKLKNTVMVQSQTADPDTGNNSDTVKIRVRR